MSTSRKLIFSSALGTLMLVGSACSSQSLQQLGDAVQQGAEAAASRPSDAEVGTALREALSNGANSAGNLASKTDGFLGNARIKIPFPPDAQRAADKLRQIGLGSQVDRFVTTINRGAEKAASSAAPIFINAIKSITIQDAWGILRGGQNSATTYLQGRTTSALSSAFRPTIKSALDQVEATKYWGDITRTYNQIPGVKPINTDLTSYVTERALSGLFVLVADEEKRIRENPVARTTEILRKVFGYKGA